MYPNFPGQIAKKFWLSSQRNLATQPKKIGYIANGYSQIFQAMQPEISGYIARFLWLYSQIFEISFWLCSQKFLAIQPEFIGYIARWLKSQKRLAIQPVAIQREFIGYIARILWLDSQKFLAIQPEILGYLSNAQLVKRFNGFEKYKKWAKLDPLQWLYSQESLAIQPVARQNLLGPVFFIQSLPGFSIFYSL